ncbi:hypothetical protein ACGFZS_46275, partial [Streptomyces sp. NPDC048288]|uniref:hypothetical protein n=1 Tax=Streptomyces sp. NPDC048288 TaxID=3365529 RepID=UPI003716FFAE
CAIHRRRCRRPWSNQTVRRTSRASTITPTATGCTPLAAKTSTDEHRMNAAPAALDLDFSGETPVLDRQLALPVSGSQN